MKREFLAKLIERRVVDTRKYRYFLTDTGYSFIIERVALADVGTSATREFVKEL